MSAVFTLSHFDRLHHMWVSTDDMVHAMFKHPVGEPFLSFVGQQMIFVTPVWHTDDDVGVQFFCSLQVSCDDGSVESVHDIGFGHGDAIGAVSVVEQADADVVALNDERILCIALLLVAVGAEVWHTDGVHHLDGAADATAIGIDAVVVASGKHVESCLFDGKEVFVGGTKLWIAFVGRTSECHLEVGDSQVGTLYLWLHQCEAVAVVAVICGWCCMRSPPKINVTVYSVVSIGFSSLCEVRAFEEHDTSTVAKRIRVCGNFIEN